MLEGQRMLSRCYKLEARAAPELVLDRRGKNPEIEPDIVVLDVIEVARNSRLRLGGSVGWSS